MSVSLDNEDGVWRTSYFPGPDEVYLGSDINHPRAVDVVPADWRPKPLTAAEQQAMDAFIAEAKRRGLMEEVQTPFGPLPRFVRPVNPGTGQRRR